MQSCLDFGCCNTGTTRDEFPHPHLYREEVFKPDPSAYKVHYSFKGSSAILGGLPKVLHTLGTPLL